MGRVWWMMGWVVWLLTGCQSYKMLLQDDSSHIQAVENTRKGELVSSQETKALLLATYLNPLDPEKYHQQEYFYVDLYFAEEDGYRSPYDISLTESGKPVSVQRLEENDPLVGQLAMRNRWGRHYVMVFPEAHPDSEWLHLVLKSKLYGETQLVFRKKEYTSER